MIFARGHHARAGKHFVSAGICFAAGRAARIDAVADVLAAPSTRSGAS